MTKSELIALTEKKYHSSEAGARSDTIEQKYFGEAINAILSEIANTLAQGDRIEIRGFGTFSARYRAARLARNPMSGERIAVKAKYVPFFRAGKRLRERLANK